MNAKTFIVLSLLLTSNVGFTQDFQGVPNNGNACLILRMLQNEIARRELMDTSYSWIKDLSKSCLRVSDTLLNDYYFPKDYNKYFYEDYFGDSLTLEEMKSFKVSVKEYVADLPVKNLFYQTCRCDDEFEPCFKVQLSPIVNQLISVKVQSRDKHKSSPRILRLLFYVNKHTGDVGGYMVIP